MTATRKNKRTDKGNIKRRAQSKQAGRPKRKSAVCVIDDFVPLERVYCCDDECCCLM